MDTDRADPHAPGSTDGPVSVPIEDSLDLHTFRPGEVRELLDDYLDAACAKGFRDVVIIHGKGQGVLRKRVRGILATHDKVAAFHDAEAERGGWGATVVKLVLPDSPSAKQASEAFAAVPETSTAETETSSSIPSGSEPGELEAFPALHHLSRPQLLTALALGLVVGALFHQVMLQFGARALPGLILPYGICVGYGLIRKAETMAQVLRRAGWAALILGGLWLAGFLMKPTAVH